MGWGNLPVEEIERRRLASVEAKRSLDREAFERRHQESMDRFYWENGKCCAGCDHWHCEQGHTGQCTAAPPVSGEQVIKSLGLRGCSYVPPPDHPYTKMDFVCGAFKDGFDWSTLEEEYLMRIGFPTEHGIGG